MTPVTQVDIDYIAKYLDVTYEVVNNIMNILEGDIPSYLAKITLRNTGSVAIKGAQNWKIYFYSIREVEPGNMTKSGVLTPNNMFTINYLNGVLYSLTPTKDFTELKPGNSMSITYRAAAANAARSDNFPNWYVAAPNTKAKVLKSTKGVNADFVKNFDTPAKWKRSAADMYEPMDPGQRYEKNKLKDLERAPLPVIPTPKEIHVEIEGNTVSIDTSKWVIVAESSLQRDAKYLSGI